MQHITKAEKLILFILLLWSAIQLVHASTDLTVPAGCTVATTLYTGGVSPITAALPNAADKACSRKVWQITGTCTGNFSITLGTGGIPTPNFFLPNSYKLRCGDLAVAPLDGAYGGLTTTTLTATFVGGAAGAATIIFNSQTLPAPTSSYYCTLCSTQDNQNQDPAGNDLLVKLASFTANTFPTQVNLVWETAFELDNAGFHLWRSESLNDNYVKITDSLIVAKGQGSYYEFTDTQVSPGKTYYYKLADIDNKGVTTLHGPITATPNSVILLAPNDNAILTISTPPTFQWMSDHYSRFTFQFSTDNGKSIQEIAATSDLTPSPEKWTDFVNTLQGQTVYWRVMASDFEGNKAFSTIRSFTVK